MMISEAYDLVPTVEFRLVVFRPFKNEVLVGRISSATDLGIRSTLPFHLYSPVH